MSSYSHGRPCRASWTGRRCGCWFLAAGRRRDVGTDGGRGRGSRTVLVAVAVASRSCGWAGGPAARAAAAAGNRRQNRVPPARATVLGPPIVRLRITSAASPAAPRPRRSAALAHDGRPVPHPAPQTRTPPLPRSRQSSLVRRAPSADPPPARPRSAEAAKRPNLSHRVRQPRSIRLDCTVSCCRITP